jgi:hypothetical protein
MLTNFFCASLTLYLTPDLEQLDFEVFELTNRSLDFRATVTSTDRSLLLLSRLTKTLLLRESNFHQCP